MTHKILLVDDDDVIRNLMGMYLQRGGFSVVKAEDGMTGIEFFRAEKPDLVVLDVAMPEMSGFEVAKRLRAIEKEEERSRTPIIILTAYARSFFLADSTEAGVDSYLTKPITPDQLLQHIKEFLGQEEA